MSSLWNLLAPARTGVVKISGSGYQMFGTVIKHGLINKTVTVRVSSQTWNNKYKRFLHTYRNKLVHDQTNYCVSGDRVIIKNCAKLSPNKAYYVKQIFKPFGRDEFDRLNPHQDTLDQPIISGVSSEESNTVKQEIRFQKVNQSINENQVQERSASKKKKVNAQEGDQVKKQQLFFGDENAESFVTKQGKQKGKKKEKSKKKQTK